MSESWRIKQPPEGAALEVIQTPEGSVLTIAPASSRGLGVRWLERVEVQAGSAIVSWRGTTGRRQATLDATEVRAVEGSPKGDDAYDVSFRRGPGRSLRVRLPVNKRWGAWVRGELERWALIG